MSSSNPPLPAPEPRQPERRSKADRRATQRRVVIDRRYASDGSPRSAFRCDEIATPTEHVRNAMQVLIAAVESSELAPDELARSAEVALERLARALSRLEEERRR